MVVHYGRSLKQIAKLQIRMKFFWKSRILRKMKIESQISLFDPVLYHNYS